MPLIQKEDKAIACAEFDAELYTDGRFDDTSDPIGNTLTTGGPPRLNDHRAWLESGLRRKTEGGASWSLSQRLGHDNSNSVFFSPNNQGNAQLSLSLRQPLLRGGGGRYNTSFIIEAEFKSHRAQAEYMKALQDRLLEVGSTYWDLYRQRGILLQRRRHVQRAAEIAEEISHRQMLDTLRSQALRAVAAVTTREAELALAEANLHNSESRIHALLNAANCTCGRPSELIPTQYVPVTAPVIPSNADVAGAIRARPEIQALVMRAKEAGIVVSQAENELLPSLDLVSDAYVSGLKGNSSIDKAWAAQFGEGAPSYGVGVQYSMPLGNRAAKSRLRQRWLEATRISLLLEDQAAVVKSEIEIAVNNARAAFLTINSRLTALKAVTAEVEYINARWRRLRGDKNLGQLQLDDLLNAQNRLFEAERALITAQSEYGNALVRLQHALGALVTAAPSSLEGGDCHRP